jgi:hypothetical protein
MLQAKVTMVINNLKSDCFKEKNKHFHKNKCKTQQYLPRETSDLKLNAQSCRLFHNCYNQASFLLKRESQGHYKKQITGCYFVLGD